MKVMKPFAFCLLFVAVLLLAAKVGAQGAATGGGVSTFSPLQSPNNPLVTTPATNQPYGNGINEPEITSPLDNSVGPMIGPDADFGNNRSVLNPPPASSEFAAPPAINPGARGNAAPPTGPNGFTSLSP